MIEGQSAPQISGPFSRAANRPPDGLDFSGRARGIRQEYARQGAQLEYSLQTNGTLLIEAWCDFFRDNSFHRRLIARATRHAPMPIGFGTGRRTDLRQSYARARLVQERQVEFNILCHGSCP